MNGRLWALTLTLAMAGAGSPAASDWPVFNGDAARSGVARNARLDAREVAGFRPRWHVRLGAVADAAPIVVGDRLVITSRDGTTSALDVHDGHLVWRFTTHGPNITTSVPAYDTAGAEVYVGGVDGAVHALDPADGRERTGRGFPITRAPETEKNASALNVAGGYLYAQTSGYIGDATPYIGHIVAVRLSDGHTTVFNSLCSSQHVVIEPATCSAQRAGMWSRAGIVADPDPAMHGRLYAATGNGPSDVPNGNYGDTILALDADGSRLAGSITPADAADLEDRDLDVGSSSPALLPRRPNSATPLLAVQGGKDRRLRLFDRAAMHGDGAIVQSVLLDGELFSVPAVWTDEKGSVFVIIALSSGVTAYRLSDSDRASRLERMWHSELRFDNEGTSPIVAGSVVFVALSGSLVALDARTGRRVWSSPIGPVHWQSPAFANGSVFCADSDGYVTAFGSP